MKDKASESELADLRKFNSDQVKYGEGKAQRVVCAACRWPDGHVVLGVRHFSPDMHLSARLQGYGIEAGIDQGFVDQYGKFLTRQEAFAIAEANDQLKGEGAPHIQGTLFSEDLY